MSTPVAFKAFAKIPRLYREVWVTEKIDGTNACVVVTEDNQVYAQSRSRIITPEDDEAPFSDDYAPPYYEELDFNKDPETEYLPEEDLLIEDEEALV